MLKRLPVLAAVGLAATVALSGCGSDGSDGAASAVASDPAAPSSSATATSTASTGPGSCQYVADGSNAEVKRPAGQPTTTSALEATLTLNAGTLPITLAGDVAPCTVNSFLSLAEQGYFDTTTCHRLTTAGIYVLQCGDPTASGSGGPGYSFADELAGATAQAPGTPGPNGERTVIYPAGTIAMANAGANTNGSQFFLVYADSTLPPAYSVFGTIKPAGVTVLTAIAAAGTADGQPDGAPKSPVTITSVTPAQ